jgi:hypothetical protein
MRSMMAGGTVYLLHSNRPGKGRSRHYLVRQPDFVILGVSA